MLANDNGEVYWEDGENHVLQVRPPPSALLLPPLQHGRSTVGWQISRGRELTYPQPLSRSRADVITFQVYLPDASRNYLMHRRKPALMEVGL